MLKNKVEKAANARSFLRYSAFPHFNFIGVFTQVITLCFQLGASLKFLSLQAHSEKTMVVIENTPR